MAPCLPCGPDESVRRWSGETFHAPVSFHQETGIPGVIITVMSENIQHSQAMDLLDLPDISCQDHGWCSQIPRIKKTARTCSRLLSCPSKRLTAGYPAAFREGNRWTSDVFMAASSAITAWTCLIVPACRNQSRMSLFHGTSGLVYDFPPLQCHGHFPDKIRTVPR